MSSKKTEARLKRARRTRAHIRELEVPRLTVYRSPQHIYAQIISADGAKVQAAASTVEKDLRGGATGNIEGATKVGQLIAERAKELAISAKKELDDKLAEFVPEEENLDEIFENQEQIEISKFYETRPKPTTTAVEEFLRGELHYQYAQAGEEDA